MRRRHLKNTTFYCCVSQTCHTKEGEQYDDVPSELKLCTILIQRLFTTIQNSDCWLCRLSWVVILVLGWYPESPLYVYVTWHSDKVGCNFKNQYVSLDLFWIMMNPNSKVSSRHDLLDFVLQLTKEATFVSEWVTYFTHAWVSGYNNSFQKSHWIRTFRKKIIIYYSLHLVFLLQHSNELLWTYWKS